MKRCLAALRVRSGSGCWLSCCARAAPATVSSRVIPRTRTACRAVLPERLFLVMVAASVRATHNTKPRSWKSCAKADIFLANFSRARVMIAGCGYEFRQYRLDARAQLLVRNAQHVGLI